MSNITINSLPTASTIDATQDILPIYTASGAATQGINRNTLLGLSSAPVGLTDSQTLTNKILTSPTINGATLSGTLSGTYTIGGTPTFPASVVTLTGSQTLTNKVLTSPTISSPTITNATISADAITGFSTSNTGSIYGISITAGQIGALSLTGNLTVGGTATVTGLLTASNGFTISSGTVTLQDGSLSTRALTNTIKFSAYLNTATNTINGNRVIPFDTKLFDTGSNLDIVTNKGRFTAPVAGFYHFDASINAAAGASFLFPAIYKNGVFFRGGSQVAGGGVSPTVYISDTLQLAANDFVEIYVGCGAVAAISTGNSPIYTGFSGFLVSKT